MDKLTSEQRENSAWRKFYLMNIYRQHMDALEIAFRAGHRAAIKGMEKRNG